MVNSHEQKHQRLEKYLVVRGPWSERPGSPVTGDLYRDTDRGSTEFAWDGTAANWLSTQRFALPVGTRGTMPFAQATTIFNVDLANLGGNGIYVTGLECAFRAVSTVQSGANFYTLSFSVSNPATVFGFTLGGVGQTDTKTVTATGTRYSMKPTFTPQAFDNTYFWGEVTMTPTSAPGTFIFFGTLVYQLIG
jgi:hypothetical protein